MKKMKFLVSQLYMLALLALPFISSSCSDDDDDPKVEITSLGIEDGATVNAAALKEAGIIKKELDGVKVLGNGAIEKKLTVQAAKFSKSAEEAITAKGGSIEVI